MPAIASARRPRLRLERLEARAVPATLVNPKTVAYSDFDGDLVTVSFTKPFLSPQFANTVFTFDTGIVDGNTSVPQQLRKIDLSAAFLEDGVGITVAARPTTAGGDGMVNVGAILATTIDLGVVTIPGDLGRIRAGDNDMTDRQGVTALSVASMGRFGTATQGGGDLASRILGPTGTIKVGGDLVGTDWLVDGGEAFAQLSVGGDLSGSFKVIGRPGRVVIGGDLTGTFDSVTGIKSVAIGGSLAGGQLIADNDVGSIRIGGHLVGGAADGSGSISVGGAVGRLTVGGDIVGGAGESAGSVRIGYTAGPIVIGGDVVGAGGHWSGRVDVEGVAKSAVVGGDVRGGAGESSGVVSFKRGASSLDIGGSVVGGLGDSSGQAGLDERSGRFRLGGDLVGGSGDAAGILYFGGDLDTFAVGGDLIGGTNRATAQVYVGNESRVGAMTVGGSLVGGSGASSGCIMASGSVDSIAIRGDMRGGSNRHSGAVFVDRAIKTMSVGGSLIGGTATADDADLLFSGGLNVRGRFGRLTVGGSVIGGSAGGFNNVVLTGTGTIRGGYDIGSIDIKGSVIGRDQRARIVTRGIQLRSGRGASFDAIAVGGRFENAEILPGYNLDPDSGVMVAESPNGCVGRVAVAGDWIASEIFAGVDQATDLLIPGGGTSIDSHIDSLTIGGQMIGTAGAGDEFRITARKIGQVKVGGTFIGPLAAGISNDSIAGIGPYGDVMIQEVQ